MINILVHHVLMICSSVRLKEGLCKIKHILLDNGYPEEVFMRLVAHKILALYYTQFTLINLGKA